ncbi:uncharacterized protein F4822DRAFT_75942 [Hypoxylon trugodes]|uniref:uncharacterized protein n=1 Tax=Hypoxylon trugodes TaxID=326681 RepID=UPI00219B024D|nr:uncharacterized protein F4822DRAFT_75942 [Hypoxylon trugodes]KAI1383387.1 hypothetical protein F4822DRAFT_75942 [Hypoxylon trugodes]
MTFNTFPSFQLLPTEVRQAIYTLATPPRFVHVQQRLQDEDEFLEWFYDAGPSQMNLHRSLTYFAHNWRERLSSYPDLHGQRRLESYNFTNTKRIRHPWQISDETPEIPAYWLLDHSDKAYELLRKSYLYSEAPIPALLHTCSESRSFLIQTGYQLAFGTRTHGPRTWFNFKHDVLFLERIFDREPVFLEYGPWGISEFDVDSLRRVRKLALGSLPSPHPRYADVDVVSQTLLHDTVRLVPNLNKLYLVEWDHCDFGEFFSHSSSSPTGNSPDTKIDRDSAVYTRELWRCVPVEDVDMLFSPMGGFPYDSYNISNVGMLGSLEKLKGGDGDCFEQAAHLKETYLANLRREIIEKESLKRSWKIPKIEIVHVCTEPMARQLIKDRHELWRRSLLLQKNWAPSSQYVSFNNSGTPATKNRPVSPTDLAWQDDWEAVHEAEEEDRRRHEVSEGIALEEILKACQLAPPRQQLIMGP